MASTPDDHAAVQRHVRTKSVLTNENRTSAVTQTSSSYRSCASARKEIGRRFKNENVVARSSQTRDRISCSPPTPFSDSVGRCIDAGTRTSAGSGVDGVAPATGLVLAPAPVSGDVAPLFRQVP
jgi:hypothetical protein